MIQVIENEAPAANVRKDVQGEAVGYTVYLDGAQLMISTPVQVKEWDGPFTVVAAAEI